MTKEQLEKWLKDFGQAWIELSPDKAMALFAKELTYYENSLKEPCKNWDGVYKLWSVVPTNQKDVTFWYEIIACSETQGVAHWKVTRTFLPTNEKQAIDGIFLISLNEEGLCSFFNQWRTLKVS